MLLQQSIEPDPLYTHVPPIL